MNENAKAVTFEEFSTCLSIAEVAKFVSLSTSMVNKILDSSKLNYVEFGSSRRVQHGELKRYVKQAMDEEAAKS